MKGFNSPMNLVKFIKIKLAILACCGLMMFPGLSGAKIIFQDDDFGDFESPFILLDNNGGTVTGIKFNNTGNPSTEGVINWDAANQIFAINQNVSFEQKQLLNVALENLTLPPPAPVAGQIYFNSNDNNTYVFNGTDWEDLTAVNSTASKVVTVGTGLDYANLAGAAGYLNGLSGGIIIMSAETHLVQGNVNLSNITLIGKGPDRTTIQIENAGKISSFDTAFSNLKLSVKSITANSGIDVQSGSNSLIFDRISFSVQDPGDSLVDSSAITQPTVSMRFIKTNQDNLPGAILKTIAGGNLNSSSTIFVDGRSGDGVLKMNDWNVTVAEAGNVLTSGIISSIPNKSIYLSPNMNLQAAIDSIEALPGGGIITLLPGTYNISSPLTIEANDIQITGYGDSSIINAAGFGGITNTTAAIQVGKADGSLPVSGTVLRDFKVQVQGNFHGIRTTGGDDNKVDNVTVQKVSGQGGSGATAVVGIQFLDSASAQLTRAVIQNARVIGNGGNNYFTDGIHITTNGSVSGTWGFNQGANNILVDKNNVDYVRETGYVFVGVNDSSLFNNRASRMGVGGGGAYGIFMSRLRNINMNANVFAGSLSTAAIAIGVDSFDINGSSTQDAIFNNNVIDGTSNGGLGFAKGFVLGNGNSFVSRSTFSNNIIRGASVAANTVAIEVTANSDDNSFADNAITGGSSSWARGIDLQSNLQERNLIRNNRYNQVTVPEIDNGTATKFGVEQKRATNNPTINDGAALGYANGTIWLNTSTNDAFILLNNTVGAAVWKQISDNGTTMQVGQFFDGNAGGGNYNLNTAGWTAIPWNSESFPEDLAYSHDTVVNNSRITILNAGLYRVSYSINHKNNTTNNRKSIKCGVRVNGAVNTNTTGDSFSHTYDNNSNDLGTNSTEVLINFNANDYYEIVCRRDGGTGDAILTTTAQGASWTLIEKIK